MNRLSRFMMPALLLLATAAAAQTVSREADALRLGRQYDQARQAYLAAAQDSQDSSAVLALKGEAAFCLLLKGDLPALKTDCEGLLVQYGENPNRDAVRHLRSMLAQIPYKQRNWSAAAESLGQFIKENPDYPPLSNVVISHADALCQLRRFSEARQELLGLIENRPGMAGLAQVRYQAAACLYKQGADDALQKEVQGLLEQYQAQGNTVEAQRLKLLLARSLQRQKKWAEAEGALQAWIEQNLEAPNLDEAVMLRADALTHQGRHGEARATLLELIAKHPQSPRIPAARQRAALCLFAQGDYAAYEQEASPLSELAEPAAAPWSGLVKIRMAQALGKQGQTGQKVAALEKMVAEETRPEHRVWPEVLLGGARMEAAAALQATSATAAATLRAKAHEGLARLRSQLEAELARTQDPAVIERTHNLLVESYYMEEDYAGLAKAAEVAAAASQAPSLVWATRMTWQGMAKCRQSPPDWAGAATALDAVLAADVADDDIASHIPSTAAYWRAYVAKAQKDESAFKAAMEKIKALPEGPIKAKALARYGAVK